MTADEKITVELSREPLGENKCPACRSTKFGPVPATDLTKFGLGSKRCETCGGVYGGVLSRKTWEKKWHFWHVADDCPHESGEVHYLELEINDEAGSAPTAFHGWVCPVCMTVDQVG